MTPSRPLPAAFLDPGHVAHRGLHGPGRPEHGRAAFRAAVEAGYAIELDAQISRDGVAMAFHDYTLDRLAGRADRVDALDAAALGGVPLLGGDGEGIPTVAEALEIIAGRVPVLVEVKDQDGDMGPNVGALERAVADVLSGYDGPAAVMSFNPHAVALMADLLPDLPRGLTTSRYDAHAWPELSEATRARLRELPDVERLGLAFISHQADAVDMPRVRALRAGGLPVLCWTIRRPEQVAMVRPYVDAITFEGFLP